MQGVERSFRAASKNRIFERVCGGSEESGCQAGNSTLREPPPTPIGSDRGHSRSFKGYPSVRMERGTDHGVGRRMSG